MSEGGLADDAVLRQLAVDSDSAADNALLFSESNTRFVLEVPADCTEALSGIFAGLPLTPLGEVVVTDRVTIRGTSGSPVVDQPLAKLKASWQQPLAWD